MRNRPEDDHPLSGLHPAERAHWRRLVAVRRREENERLRSAKRAWQRLSRKRKLETITEIVITRSTELKAAYHGVTGVAVGFRTRGAPNQNRQRRYDEPCVRFLVERKWEKRNARDAPRQGEIPGQLWALAAGGKYRPLCAVPTDVASRASLRAHDGCDRGLVRLSSAALPERCASGMVACVLRINGGSERLALSCTHVFGLRHATDTFPVGARVTERATGQPVATIVRRHGVLLEVPPAVSFDAALAVVDGSASAVARAIPKVASTKWLQGASELADGRTCTIHTQDAQLTCQITGEQYPGELELEYEFPDGARHLVSFAVRTLEFTVNNGETDVGDSGSPVTDHTGKFVGMHIGGAGNRSFVIPAFELLDPSQYIGIGKDAELRLTLDYS